MRVEYSAICVIDRDAGVHPGSPIVPAALAACGRCGANGDAFIRAAIVDYEISSHPIGSTVTPPGGRYRHTAGTVGAHAAIPTRHSVTGAHDIHASAGFDAATSKAAGGSRTRVGARRDRCIGVVASTRHGGCRHHCTRIDGAPLPPHRQAVTSLQTNNHGRSRPIAAWKIQSALSRRQWYHPPGKLSTTRCRREFSARDDVRRHRAVGEALDARRPQVVRIG
jgi:hypothetical protein